MWLRILCYFCCPRKNRPQLSAAEKRKKWIRLVGVMTLKQYGTRFISNLFYTILIAEALTAMKSIWADFKTYSDCNNEYTANLTRSVSQQYSEAADALAAAVSEQTECLTSTVDVDIGGFGLGIGGRLGDVFGDVFGWFTPGQGTIPMADLDLQSNSEKIMEDIADDMSFLGKVAFWVRFVGFIMTFVTVVIIVLKATYYTVENLPWKPGTVGLMFRLIEILQVMGIYAIVIMAVFLQAYFTDKSCQVNVNNTVIATPMCEVVGEECEFQCTTYEQNFTSPCTECDIKLGWWWMEPISWPNILCAAYLIFLCLVIVVELMEARNQKKQVSEAERREKEEQQRERERQRAEKEKRKKASAEKKKKKPKTRPPEDEVMESRYETLIDVDSDSADRPKKKKSRSKHKSSKSDHDKQSSKSVSLLGDSEIEPEMKSTALEDDSYERH